MRAPGRALIVLALFVGGLFLHGSAVAAQVHSGQRITLQMEQATMEQVISHISETTNHKFLYRVEDLSSAKRDNYSFNGASLDQVMDDLVAGTMLVWNDDNGTIVISRMAQQQPQGTRIVMGRVTDESGAPLLGATVVVKGVAGRGTSTGADGMFRLGVPAGGSVLVVSYVGMDTREIPLVQGTNEYNVTMSGAIEVETVTVNAGIMRLDAITYTGSYTTVSQAELKETGTLNVLNALSSIDPAFIIVENNFAGSNPNVMPTIEINGKTSLNIRGVTDEFASDPNLPLFIIDGFRATLEKVNDLNMNRVESITILKDSGSTAIYGSEGANGVVVIETIKPKPGELIVEYDLNIMTSFADLSGYNLMNAREKLEFERLAGYYDGSVSYSHPAALTNYYNVLELVEAGVDTYWMKYPLRTAIQHNHNLSVSGGDERLVYRATVGYRSTPGVMKGQSRENVNGDVFLQYNYKNLRISNDIEFGSTISHNGSYGQFSDWANVSPYYQPYDGMGNLMQNLNIFNGLGFLVRGRGDYYANPLYNASLDTDRMGKSIEFINRTNAEYIVEDINLVLRADLELSRTSGTNEDFIDPRHTRYREKPYNEKGSYSYSNNNGWNWITNVSANWHGSIDNKHNFTLNASAGFENHNYWGSGYNMWGLPIGAKPNPSQGNYVTNSHPSYNTNITRRVRFIGQFNYDFEYRYFVHFSYNRSGGTTFGKNNPFSDDWSVGAGWNVDREKFAENWTWLNRLKIRGSYGTNSNQSLSTLSSNVYGFMTGTDYFGQAWELMQLANPNLEWQKTIGTSFGFEIELFDSRLSADFEVFNKMTDPLVVSVGQPPSTGTGNYDLNLGWMRSRGWNAKAAYNIIRRPNDGVLFSVRLTAGHNDQEYGGFGDAFERLNDELSTITDDENSNMNTNEQLVQLLKRFRDGNDPEALWAVRSLGIDPSTGYEMFLDKDGNPTRIYDKKNEFAFGSSRDKVSGAFGFTFNYKHFRSSFNFFYGFGGSQFNNALWDRVENITASNIMHNQDRRALYDRWKSPGDVSQFKAIRVEMNQGVINTPYTTRYIQKNNYIKATGIQLGWDFYDSRFLDVIGFERLIVNVQMNDIFRISSIKAERGLNSPFARNITFSLTMGF